MIGQAYPARRAPLDTVVLRQLPKAPLISIVVPSYNQGRFIRATIDSILTQDYRPIRIHVIDGASTDETVEVLKSYGDIPELDWISESDEGVVDAVNKGFSKTTGEIVAIQSSDDLYLPGAIRKMVEQLIKLSDYGLVYADFETVDSEGTVLYASLLRPFSLRGFLCKETWIPQPAAFFRREMIEVCGGWDAEYFNADTELWLRMVFRTKVKKINDCIAQRRLHENQRNMRGVEILASYKKMIRNSWELEQSSPHLRRAAKAAVHMLSIKYGNSKSLFIQSYHLWVAALLAPSLWPLVKQSPLLVPGWLHAKNYVSSVKKRIWAEPK